MADISRYKMSQERLDDLKKELEYCETVREKEVSELIKEARSFGDLSENSEYDEAKTEQGKLYSRIAELKDLIENAEIVEKQANPREGRISDDSPIGQALFGHSAGDTIELETEMGILEFKVVAVVNN